MLRVFHVRVLLSVLFSYQGRDLQAGAEVALRSGDIPEALRQAQECENEYSRLDDRQGLSAAFRLLGNIQFVDGQALASVGSLQVRLTEDSASCVVAHMHAQTATDVFTDVTYDRLHSKYQPMMTTLPTSSPVTKFWVESSFGCRMCSAQKTTLCLVCASAKKHTRLKSLGKLLQGADT